MARKAARPPSRAARRADLECVFRCVEPGIYFPPHVLEDPEIRRQHRDTVVWNRVDKLRGFGGIRIEDNVLILDGGNEVLTRAIPKE